jgi:hypothetical protein
MAAVAEPFYVTDVAELAQKLALGGWVVFRHEALGDTCDLATWIAVVRGACAQLDVVERVVTIARRDLTIVFNAEDVPTDDQIHESVRRVEHDRWMDRELRSELAVRTARRSPAP